MIRAVVVIPARDEAQRVGACLRALAAQRGIAPEQLASVILVLDRCTDDTEAVARAVAAETGLSLRVEHCLGAGVGAARRHGMELACLILGDDGLIATTDADTEVAPDWLAVQLALVAQGADAIGGRIELDPDEAAALPPDALARRERRAHARMRIVADDDPGAEHHFFSGASLGVTARAYRAVGGLEPRAALEDEAFAARLTAAGLRIVRSDAVRVRTSGRTDGRAGRGLARDLQLGEWLARRRHDGFSYGLNDLLEAKGDTTVSVVLPARDCAATIERVLTTTVLPFADAGLVDEVLVVDGRSTDATMSLAERAGARVEAQDDLLPEHGPALGKGDAMWRGLAATTGDVVAYLDADTRDPAPVHLLGLLGPLLAGNQQIQLVKGAFDRPFDDGAAIRPAEGGRVTELMARPLLNLLVPQLAGFEQPLAGETAARRELLEALAFPVGYGVEIAMLIDALRHAGLDALAESRLGTRQNEHQPLRDLGAMAFAVLCAVQARVPMGDAVPAGLVQPWADGAVRDVPVAERPPLRQRVSSGIDVLGAA
ncbi:glucosyl-3-phosphoglycerate synthase [Baekduia sp. Peel2402]|uniref:glucosyl-3-phosphoglycerate synthase n=1 Tax=Baekduia sp. Peel2402 TaxID=3458296 RepID=UPI00403EE016